MGRLGRAFYVRSSGEAIYKFFQNVTILGMGYDQLPEGIKQSTVFTGNNLGQLASLPKPPSPKSVEILRQQADIKAILASDNTITNLHRYAQKELAKENVEFAAQIAWLGETI